VISKLTDDHILAIILSDQLILEFEQRRYDKTGIHQQKHQHIAQRMRELWRLVIQANKSNASLKQLSYCIKETQCKTAIVAVKCEAVFDNETLVYGCPSFTVKCWHSLKKMRQDSKEQSKWNRGW